MPIKAITLERSQKKEERGKGIKDNNQIKNKQIKVVKDGEKKTVRGCMKNTQIQADKEVQCDAEMRRIV